MRAAWVLLMGAVGCGHGGIQAKVSACERAAGADPGACLAVARDRLARHDAAGVQQFMDNTVQAMNASPACLNDHPAQSCFAGVAVLLRDEPVGLLADAHVELELVQSVPRWNGSDAEGPRAQARTALQGMCKSEHAAPGARQRACLILGDLVEDERTKRCGPDCDLAHAADELAGWGPRDVIDGYATACTLAKAAPDPELARRVAEVYAVDARDAVCAVATAPQRGASIPNAVAGRARAVFETRQREAAAVAAAAREAQRTAQLKQREEAARVASEQAAASAATSQLTAAADKGDYATMLELVRKRRRGEANAAAADAVLRRWDELIAWIGGDTSIIGAYLELADATRAVAPPGHALLAKLDALRTRALADVKRRARGARGVGGAWLYAALAEKIAGPGEMVEAKASAAAFAKLTTAVRPSLVIDRLARACAPIRPEMTRGKTVRVASTLTCTIEPEKTWTTTEMVPGEIDMEAEDAPARLVPKDVVHRAYKLIVHGDLAVTSGGPRRVVPIDIDDILDDGGAGDETDTYEAARAKAMATIRAAVLGPIEAADAEAAYAAGQRALAVKRTAAAEDALVRHALLVGASPELDQLLTPYAVAFPELLPANR